MEPEEIFAKTNSALLPYVVPLVLVPHSDAPPGDIVHSASGALVDTGKKRLLVTCHHVWKEFRDKIALNPEMRAAAVIGKGPAWVINDLPLLGDSARLDLSVLDLTRSELGEALSQRFATVPSWPPERPKAGDSLALIGFPGSDKEVVANQDGRDLVQFYTTSLMVVVSSVSDQNIVLADTDDSRREITLKGKKIEPGFSFGGMSGCPAFVSRDGRFDFAGIMRGGPPTDDYKGIFFLAHASFIDEDGQINWSQAPFV